MQNFTALEYIYAGLGAELGYDKETWSTRIRQAKLWYNYIWNGSYQGMESVMASYVYALNQVYKGNPIGVPVRLDWGSSGISIQSCVFRDPIGLQNTGGIRVLKPTGVYGMLMEALGLDPSDKAKKDIIKKKCALPYVYAGDSGVENYLGVATGKIYQPGEALKEFGDAYKSLFPSAFESRNAFLDAWDDNLSVYKWHAPDGFMCHFLVESTERKTKLVMYYFEQKYNKLVTASYHKPYLTTKTIGNKMLGIPRDQGTRGIGANLVQSTDAYILREIIRRGKASLLKANFTKYVTSTSGVEPTGVVKYLLKVYRETGVPSLSILEYLDCKTKLPKDVCQMLLREVNTLQEDYDVLPVHDEFGVLPTKVDSLRHNANRVFAGIYASNLGNYWNEVFGTNIHVNAFDEKVYQEILDSDYLIC